MWVGIIIQKREGTNHFDLQFEGLVFVLSDAYVGGGGTILVSKVYICQGLKNMHHVTLG